MIYRLFWEEAQRQGALSGYAHYGAILLNAPSFGLAVDLPHGLLSFLEVLQFNRGVHEAWYEILNTGFRITPTAGTDYPCVGASIPGRERFYTRVEGPFTYENWLEGVRKGRTFVTNGPILEFRIDGKEMGEEVVLEQAGSVDVQGRVRFDPTWDDIERLEVVENGPVQTSSRPPPESSSDGVFRGGGQVDSFTPLKPSGPRCLSRTGATIVPSEARFRASEKGRRLRPRGDLSLPLIS